ncbi:aminotransferase class I/II-fold pyridoxal phosphate-dependent enzyme [Solirubrobacter soli]|uniref:aminotransferase class I/II-fold pyridoxal phosphate-dependent enzyme n=1 Tax=Solirubrobacter soli TaxID=363832 RepID=UPI0004279463|nr:aminotransferase class I/II-fold pyridoxal phosphate-dependent enzyme [Solirubrobacter soli]
MESYIAPWATPPALARLSAVEAALPTDAAFALERAARSAREHARRLDEDCLQLYAGTNVPSPLVSALHEAALAAQPSMGYPGAKYQAGLEPIDVVEVTAANAIARLMGAAFAEVRPTSATLANLAVYTALTEPGDTIAVLPDWAGGHLSHHAVGVPSVRGLRVAPLPYDAAELDVDVDALDEFLGWEVPRLVVVGASLMLFPHRLTAISETVRAHGIPLLYDASHVAGLIAEGRFQDPLREGADLVTFSTYKSFGGPPGGVIVTNDEELAEQVANAVFPALVANYDASRLVPLAAAALERDRSGGGYADQCIANAQALAAALSEAGLDVLAAARGFTESHHVAIDVPGGGTAAALKLAESNILSSEIGVPVDPAGGVRFGTQAITRQGFVSDDMPAIAAAIAAVLLHDRDVRADVADLRRRHTGLRWCLTPEDLP